MHRREFLFRVHIDVLLVGCVRTRGGSGFVATVQDLRFSITVQTITSPTMCHKDTPVPSLRLLTFGQRSN